MEKERERERERGGKKKEVMIDQHIKLIYVAIKSSSLSYLTLSLIIKVRNTLFNQIHLIN